MRDGKPASNAGAANAASSEPVGYLTITQIVKHSEPVYATSDGGTYGSALDGYIRQLYKDKPDMVIQNLALEIGEDAAFALRDRCNRGEY